MTDQEFIDWLRNKLHSEFTCYNSDDPPTNQEMMDLIIELLG